MVELGFLTTEQAPERVVRTHEELNATLQDASLESRAAGKLNAIFLFAPNRDHLTLVVGGEETVVGFNYGHGDPPYYVSVGEADAEQPVLTAFVGLEHHTEFPRKWVVPIALGQQAAHEFLETGKRPNIIAWTEP